MLKLFYAPGACSLASHISLEEAGAQYETQAISLADGENRQSAYLAINPHGKVPALQTDEGTITENLAIQYYIAKTFPDARLAPTGTVGESRWLSTNAWLASTVHTSFARVIRPGNISTDTNCHASIKEAGRAAAWDCLQEIDRTLARQPWMLGDQFTTSDAYAMVFYTWGLRGRLTVGDLKHYTAWKDRMLERPAVRKVLEKEKSPLLQAA